MTNETETDTTYNGWANRATWNVNLWIQNDEGFYGHARDLMEAWNDDCYGTLEESFDERAALEVCHEVFGSWKTPDGDSLHDADMSAIADALVDLWRENR